MIEFKDIVKQYKSKVVIDHLSMTIQTGELVVLVGASGCGKTTTLKMINRLIEPSEGEIQIDGACILRQDVIKLRRTMGYVIQQTGLFPHMTVRQNIEIIMRLEKMKPEVIKDRTLELMKMVNLEDESFLDRYPVELSGGQRQRIGVARAFATNPDIILMDEPFSALDPLSKEALQDQLLELQQTYHKTIVFVTHDMTEAIKLADRICMMDDGKIIQYDTPEMILKHPANEFVSQFVGKNRIWESPEFIRIQDIMTEEMVVGMLSMTLLQCLNRMRVKRVNFLLITNKQHHLLGIVSAKDIQSKLSEHSSLETIMKQPDHVANQSQSLLELMNLLDLSSIDLLPVVDDHNVLVGIVTKSTLVTTLSQQYVQEEGVINNDVIS